MIRADSTALKIAVTTPQTPAWARPGEGAPAGESAALEAAFLAGAGLGALDAFLRLAPPWAGVWRRRLALTAAVASVSLIGRREDEAALRDAWALRRPADDPGPAGRILAAWRSLSERSDPLAPESVQAAAQNFGLALGDALPAIVAAAQELAAGDRPAVLAAAEASRRVVALRPDAELLAFWVADAVLAARLRWTVAIPLLAVQVLHPRLKAGAAGRRPKAGDADWLRACCLAYARAAGAACDLGADLGRRADRLNSVAPKLRAKGADAVIAALLEDDALTAAGGAGRMGERALRRLFDRLVSLGAVRELSGRDSFRLYGL
ncbi:DUF1403 family protein [Methylocapsa sp. S129]|uniref:DUF1403 family protein n=1 Tax=Methylocapsa sp. S129 TaxID=1641869 RepID=UPI00131AF569|nr:DUF1403 family protein [Methylocapsa sp. S129]